MICVCWSPDGKYIVTGGQDDLVSIWSLAERKIVARCQGHHSWVSAVAFDPWRCDERTYRFGSVGDDCRLLLWDFNVGMLHRPKAVSPSFDILKPKHFDSDFFLPFSTSSKPALDNGTASLQTRITWVDTERTARGCAPIPNEQKRQTTTRRILCDTRLSRGS